MSNIKVLDIINVSETCRKELISTNQHYGIDTSNSATLPEAISDYKLYGTKVRPEGHEVRWIDIDGRCETTYIADGEDAVAPFTPNYDPEYLEFNRWICTASSLQNVTHEMDCGAYYQPKALETTDPLYIFMNGNSDNIRPSIYKVTVDSSNLTITLSNYINSTGYCYIDWGDNTIEVATTSSSHTYSEAGKYVLRFCAYAPTRTCYGAIQNITGCKCTAVYLGNHGFSSSSSNLVAMYQFLNSHPIEVIVISESCLKYNPSSYTKTIPCGYYKALIYPFNTNNTYMMIPICIQNTSGYNNLKYIVFEYGYINVSSNLQSCQYCLDKLILPDSITNINYRSFPGLNLRKLYALNVITSTESSSTDRDIWTPIVSADELDLKLTSIPKFLFGEGSYQLSYSELRLPKIFTINNEVSSIAEKWCGISEVDFNGRKIEQINIPLDFNVPLFTLSGNNSKGYPSIWLNDNNILSIAQNLKDNSNESTSNTLIFNTLDEFRFTHIFVDSTSGQQVLEGTAGAITLLQYIQNKNWTVSFS